MKASNPRKLLHFDTGPLLTLQRHNYFFIQTTVERDGLVSVFQLGEASEHGFADRVFVRVGSGEVVVGAFGAESSSLRSQLSLRGRENTKRVVVRLVGVAVGRRRAANQGGSSRTAMGVVMPCWLRPRPLPSFQPMACNILFPMLSLLRPSFVGCS